MGCVPCHGTSLRNWKSIQNEGLSKMKRKHIHFGQYSADSGEKIGSMNDNSEVFIFLDVQKFLECGGVLYFSAVFVQPRGSWWQHHGLHSSTSWCSHSNTTVAPADANLCASAAHAAACLALSPAVPTSAGRGTK